MQLANWNVLDVARFLVHTVTSSVRTAHSLKKKNGLLHHGQLYGIDDNLFGEVFT